MGLGPKGAVVTEAVEERGLPEVEEGGHRGEGAAEELMVEAGGAPDDFVKGFRGFLSHGRGVHLEYGNEGVGLWIAMSYVRA